MSCNHGAKARLSLDGNKFGFMKFIPRSSKQITDGATDTITGTLDLEGNRVAEGIVIPKFDILMEPDWEELLVILPLLGLEGSGTHYELSDDIPEFDTLIDYHQDDSFRVHQYADSVVGAWEWFGQKGTDPCKLLLHCFAKNWDPTSTWSGVSNITPDGPVPFNGGTTISDGGADMLFDRFKLAVDRMIHQEHNNSLTPTDNCARRNEVALGTSYPYTSEHSAPLDTAFSAPAVAREIILSHVTGAKSLTITLTTAFHIAQGIPILGKENIREPIHYRIMGYTDPDTFDFTPSVLADLIVP